MRRWLVWVLLALVAGEAGVFLWKHGDVVSLSRPADALAADPRFAETAHRVLAQPDVTRRVLERIADVAARRSDSALQLQAITRIAAVAPGDRHVQLRLAEALRRDGRLDDAAVVYRALLTPPGVPGAGGSQ